MARKRIIIIAGPNGAGKTTFAREFLPREADCPLFVNGDLIAAGLSPFAPEHEAVAAGRLMLKRVAELERRGDSFAFETTLSGRAYLIRISRWHALGYYITLYFLALPDVAMAVSRVDERVRQGGHYVSAELIARRFRAGRANFEELYRHRVDDWVLFDNSGPAPVPVDWSKER